MTRARPSDGYTRSRVPSLEPLPLSGATNEGELHRQLKQAACLWLWQAGYAAICDEVVVPGVGVIDVVAAGRWRRWNPRRVAFTREPSVDRHHVVFVECKAMRADFLRDQGRQQQFAFALREKLNRRRAGRPDRPRHASRALGKFDRCLLRPHANLHYLLSPPGLLRVKELPRRWGWLVYDTGRIRVVRRASWQEVTNVVGIEGAIGRTLTARRMRAVRPQAGLERAPHCDTRFPGAAEAEVS